MTEAMNLINRIQMKATKTPMPSPANIIHLLLTRSDITLSAKPRALSNPMKKSKISIMSATRMSPSGFAMWFPSASSMLVSFSLFSINPKSGRHLPMIGVLSRVNEGHLFWDINSNSKSPLWSATASFHSSLLMSSTNFSSAITWINQ